MLPEPAYAAAVTAVAGIPLKRLRALLDAAPASAVWADLRRGRWGDDWRDRAARIDVAALWEAHRAAGIDVLMLGQPGYPAALATDVDAPAVLFAVGQPAVVDRCPRVAIIGTRSATRYGLGVAAQIGADLAAAGVAVISGLAPGISGAAHEGAVAGCTASGSDGGPPVGVVAGGLDDPRPRRHAGLWARIASTGAVLSEWPVGTAELPWRLMERNRIIAALADVLVVVESHGHGDALQAVRLATRRGVSVGAVPGSVRSPASAGTNDLLADGCFVVRDAADVLVSVGLARAGDVPVRPYRDRQAGVADRPVDEPVDEQTATVLAAVDWEPSSVEQLLGRTGLPIDVVSAALEQLRTDRLVHCDAGWWERA
jgi:DNA processing protein